MTKERITRNPRNEQEDYGELDEVWIEGCDVHLEQLDKGLFYLGIYRGDKYVQINISKSGANLQETNLKELIE